MASPAFGCRVVAENSCGSGEVWLERELSQLIKQIEDWPLDGSRLKLF